MSRCIIVGTGPSAKGFIQPEGVDIIAVNGAINKVKATHFFTLDPRGALKYYVSPKKDVKYHIASDGTFSLPSWVEKWKRVGKMRRGNQPLDKNSVEWLIWKDGATKGLQKEGISNGNSGYGAINLAYHLGYKYVALVGIDGVGKNYKHLNELIGSIDPKMIDITSLGLVNSVKQMSLEEWLEYSNG